MFGLTAQKFARPKGARARNSKKNLQRVCEIWQVVTEDVEAMFIS